MRFSGTSLPRSRLFGFEVSAAQSSGEWPGSRMIFREARLPGGMIEEVGAIDAFGRTFVGGTRREAAAEGGGRRTPFPGRGGADILPNVAGFRRGGLEDLICVTVGSRGGACSAICGKAFSTAFTDSSFAFASEWVVV